MIHRFAMRRAALVALVLVPALWSCSGGSSNDVPSVFVPPLHDVEIVQDAENAGPNAFSPSDIVLSLASGDTVTWFNADLSGSYGGGPGTNHHLTSDDGTTFDSGIISPLGVFQATFSAPGTYAYRCEIHSSMRGTVTVNP